MRSLSHCSLCSDPMSEHDHSKFCLTCDRIGCDYCIDPDTGICDICLMFSRMDAAEGPLESWQRYDSLWPPQPEDDDLLFLLSADGHITGLLEPRME